MPTPKQPLPDFEDPPVIETVLGVEFASLAGWNIPHFGLFWNEVRDDYPQFEIQPPIVTPDDVRTKEDRILQTLLVPLAYPPVRCWYIHSEKTRLLQIQNDRFIHNWRKTGSGDVYPRYEKIRPIFEHEWNRFTAFLSREGIDVAVPARCEVTYVNQLLKGKEWDTLTDLNKVFPTWTGRNTDGWLPSPDVFAVNLRYPMPLDKGHLTVQVQPAIRQSDRKDILQMTLTAKGRPASPAITDLLAWFDLGREWVVRGFADFTSPEMHKLWRRKD